jgi:hypothetical protein
MSSWTVVTLHGKHFFKKPFSCSRVTGQLTTVLTSCCISAAWRSKIKKNFPVLDCGQTLGHRRNWNPGMRFFFRPDCRIKTAWLWLKWLIVWLRVCWLQNAWVEATHTHCIAMWTYPTDRESSRRLRLPGFSDNQHLKLTRLSALRTGRLYPQERFMVLISVRV